MPGKTYEKAGKAIEQRVRRALKTWHSRLLVVIDEEKPKETYELPIETILAFGSRDRYGVVIGDAITVRGCKAAACIRITKLEERVAGRGDAIIWIDGDSCKDWQDATFDAIIDHELTHLEIIEGKYGGPCFDDAGRLRLKIRPHDFEVGWFEEVAERHGAVSAEAIQASVLVAKQMYFPGFEILPTTRRTA